MRVVGWISGVLIERENLDTEVPIDVKKRRKSPSTIQGGRPGAHSPSQLQEEPALLTH